MKRCSWVDENNVLYVRYHDNEWGKPIHDDRLLFEMLQLEGFQAGLSWLTILKKRAAFQLAFDNFDAHKIVAYDEKKIAELLQNTQIIRSRTKIMATITNARIFLQIQQKYGSFNNYIWHWTNGQTLRYNIFPPHTKNELSSLIANDLKKHGMKYVGNTIIYSYLQAIGVINDHEPNCFCVSKT